MGGTPRRRWTSEILNGDDNLSHHLWKSSYWITLEPLINSQQSPTKETRPASQPSNRFGIGLTSVHRHYSDIPPTYSAPRWRWSVGIIARIRRTLAPFSLVLEIQQLNPLEPRQDLVNNGFQPPLNRNAHDRMNQTVQQPLSKSPRFHATVSSREYGFTHQATP